MHILIIIFIIIFIILYLYKDNIKINLLVILIVSRGILAPNKFWWIMSDLLLDDPCSIKLFYKLKASNKGIIPISTYTTDIVADS